MLQAHKDGLWPVSRIRRESGPTGAAHGLTVCEDLILLQLSGHLWIIPVLPSQEMLPQTTKPVSLGRVAGWTVPGCDTWLRKNEFTITLLLLLGDWS